MAGWSKHVAFDVTPDWWNRSSSAVRQLVVAAAGVLVPQRLELSVSIFAVGSSVFAYDISVPEEVSRDELDALRDRIVAELESARALLPFATSEVAEPLDASPWYLSDENGAA